MSLLAGQSAVVTAGAAGIGRALAETFLREGARVAVCDIDAAAVAEFGQAYPDAMAVIADVGDEAQMAAFLDAAAEAHGGPDIVCSNAGTGGPAAAIEDLSLDDWQGVLNSNLQGAFLTCRWAAARMKAQGKGCLILTSSTAGLFGYPLRTPYATAKWGIIGLMKSLAIELGPSGIRVNAICPGSVEGDRMDRVVANEARARGVSEDEVRGSYVANTSLRTWVSAQDIANMALFLASDAGTKISGQAIAVDGNTETKA